MELTADAKAVRMVAVHTPAVREASRRQKAEDRRRFGWLRFGN